MNNGIFYNNENTVIMPRELAGLSNLVSMPNYKHYDVDADNYINSVELLDNRPLKPLVKNAINEFVIGCKKDNLWDRMEQCGILMGANTLSGALVCLNRFPSITYSPELLWPTTASVNLGGFGGSASWDPDTWTITNSIAGTSTSYPRLTFADFGGGVTQRYYMVQGILQGDITSVQSIVLGASIISYDSTTGIFNGLGRATADGFRIQFNGTVAPWSVTIQTISIKEVSIISNANFVSGDYSRLEGLKGNGTNKYLSLGRQSNFFSVNNFHMSLYVSAVPTDNTKALMGQQAATGGHDVIYTNGSSRCKSATTDNGLVDPVYGFIGISRAASSNYQKIVNNGDIENVFINSTNPTNGPLMLFQRFASTGTSYTDARICFYSMGRSLNLNLLKHRVSNLYQSIRAS